jgi:hypothetical protein
VTTPAPPSTRLAGTASSWVRDLLARPDRSATVVHAGAHAVYLDLDGECLGILAATASAVPCGIRTLLRRLPAIAVGEKCLAGSGRISLGPTEVRVGRVVDYAVPPLDAQRARCQVPAPGLDGMPGPALAQLGDSDPACVPALLGLGSGLTPLGDDVLAGWLAAMVAAGHPGRHAVAYEVTRLAPARTTLLSATLLACAMRGDVLPEYAALVGALGRDYRFELEQLAAVGHTSGRGMLLGLSLALPEICRTCITTRRTA